MEYVDIVELDLGDSKNLAVHLQRKAVPDSLKEHDSIANCQ